MSFFKNIFNQLDNWKLTKKAKDAIKKNSPYSGIIIILAIIVLFSLAGRRGHDETFREYIDAYSSGNGKRIVSLMPKEYISSLIDSGTFSSKQEIIDAVQAQVDWYLSAYESRVGEGYNYEANITHTVKFSEDDTSMEYFALSMLYRDRMESVKKGSTIYFNHTVYADGDPSNMHETEDQVTLVKIGQKWYIGKFDIFIF